VNQPKPFSPGAVLVTGAGGMLGSHIVEILSQNGYRVKAMVLPGSPANNLQGLPVEIFYGDIRDADTCKIAVSDCTMVIHTAAALSTWPTRSATLRAINITGTQNMVQAAIDAGIQRFVHISTASCFGPGDKNHPATEKTPFRGARYRLDYVDSKYAAQQYILEAVRSEGFPAVVICPTFMIGPNDVNLGSGQMIVAAYTQKLRFLSPGGKNFVYVRDVAQAAVNALQLGTPGETYIAGNINLTYRQFFALVGEITGTTPPHLPLPGWIILVAGFVSSVLATLLHFRPLLNYSQALVSLDTQFYSPAKAVEELHMPQTDIRIALKAAFEWLRREQYCP